MIVTESTADVFLTVTENEALPPGSGRDVGSAVFVTRIELPRSVIVTVASSSAGDRVAVVVGAGGGDDVGVLAAGVAGHGTA